MSHFTVLVIGDDVEGLLAPYDEEIRVPEYVAHTREELIERRRVDIERTRTGNYAEYLADPEGYAARFNADNVRYLRDEFPAELTWIKFIGESIDEKGGELSTYNPKSKWDWWTVGGRWSGVLVLRDGTRADSALKSEVDWPATRADDKNRVPTFAVLDSDGWHERGRMGWWGMVSDKKPDPEWRDVFWAHVDAAPETERFTVVDCHI
jgi:hypothetical protein